MHRSARVARGWGAGHLAARNGRDNPARWCDGQREGCGRGNGQPSSGGGGEARRGWKWNAMERWRKDKERQCKRLWKAKERQCKGSGRPRKRQRAATHRCPRQAPAASCPPQAASTATPPRPAGCGGPTGVGATNRRRPGSQTPATARPEQMGSAVAGIRAWTFLQMRVRAGEQGSSSGSEGGNGDRGSHRDHRRQQSADLPVQMPHRTKEMTCRKSTQG